MVKPESSLVCLYEKLEKCYKVLPEKKKTFRILLPKNRNSIVKSLLDSIEIRIVMLKVSVIPLKLLHASFATFQSFSNKAQTPSVAFKCDIRILLTKQKKKTNVIYLLGIRTESSVFSKSKKWVFFFFWRTEEWARTNKKERNRKKNNDQTITSWVFRLTFTVAVIFNWK